MAERDPAGTSRQEHRQALKAIDDLVEELSGCRIEPVRIFQHNQ